MIASRPISPPSRFALVESIEPRRMLSATYSYYDGSTATDVDGTYFAMALFGDNGDTSGMPTIAAGDNDTVESVGYPQWDSDLSDGVDTGDMSAVFSLNTDSSHTGDWVVNGVDSGAYSVSSSLQIHSVTLRAAVSGPGMAFDWSNVQIDFYHNGSVVESDSITDRHANTLDSQTSDPAESIAVVTPGASNVDGVRISGTIRMRANEGTYPGWTDIQGQIAVS